MRLLFAIATVVVLGLALSCGGGGGSKAKVDTRTAGQVVADLKAKGLPIADTIDLTAENDPEKLLGRPGQYTSRTNFRDQRIGAGAVAEALRNLGNELGLNPNNMIPVQAGGAVEVFPSAEDAAKRKTYLETISKTVSAAAEYDYQRDNVVLRLARGLTPTEAQAYADAFMK